MNYPMSDSSHIGWHGEVLRQLAIILSLYSVLRCFEVLCLSTFLPPPLFNPPQTRQELPNPFLIHLNSSLFPALSSTKRPLYSLSLPLPRSLSPPSCHQKKPPIQHQTKHHSIPFLPFLSLSFFLLLRSLPFPKKEIFILITPPSPSPRNTSRARSLSFANIYHLGKYIS